MGQNSWKARVKSGLLSASLLLGANSGVADPTAIVKLPQYITFKGSAGVVQIAVLYGDPAKLGLYVVRLKLPGGAKVMPHTHPEEVRTLTVLSGTLYFGFGEQWDENKLTPYPAGTFFFGASECPSFCLREGRRGHFSSDWHRAKHVDSGAAIAEMTMKPSHCILLAVVAGVLFGRYLAGANHIAR